MAKLSESLAWIVAGVAVGTVGYLAYKHRDDLKEVVGEVLYNGEQLLNKNHASEPVAATCPSPETEPLTKENTPEEK